MESKGYYLRLRGRVGGPYALDELKKQAERGTLSRVHEISRDRLAWSAAGNFEALFPGENAHLRTPLVRAAPRIGAYPPPLPSAAIPTPQTAMVPTALVPPAKVPVAGPSALKGGSKPLPEVEPRQSGRHYYRQHGITVGPMEWDRLKLLAGTGKLDPAAEVWSAIGQTPTSAAAIPGLVFARPDVGAKPADRFTRAHIWVLAGVAGLALLVTSAGITYLIRKMYTDAGGGVSAPIPEGRNQARGH